MSIQHDHTLHPVTALAFYSKESEKLLILAGEGSFLKFFEAYTSRLIHQCQIFQGQCIHGIAIQENVVDDTSLHMVIWGGSELVLLTAPEVRAILHQKLCTYEGVVASASDWVMDVAISPHDPQSCVLVTAHNGVLRVRFDKDCDICIEELHSPSKSILYSAHLLWDSSDTILVAAGTVFGEIIAWTCVVTLDANQSVGQVLHTFTGHEGSIFGVAISPKVAWSDRFPSRLLVSCSDDRTIRIWDLASVVGDRNAMENAISLRETGFGDNGQNSEDGCIALAMGHASRIWRVKFLVDSSESSELINILSFGEDSTTQQWIFVRDDYTKFNLAELGKGPGTTSKLTGRLLHQNSSGFHSGKHISASSLHCDASGSLSLATGGADGKVARYPVNIVSINQAYESSGQSEPAADDGGRNEPLDLTSWELAEIFTKLNIVESLEEVDHIGAIKEPPVQQTVAGEETPKTKKKSKPRKFPKDAFNRYAFISQQQAIVTTTFGRVLLVDIENSPSWQECHLPESGKYDLKSWSVVKGFPAAGIAILAGTSGILYAYHGGVNMTAVGRVDGKVADMFIVCEQTTETIGLIVTNLYADSFTYFDVQIVAEGVVLSTPTPYDLPPKFNVTSANVLEGFLVIGTRQGSLLIYDNNKHLIDIGQSDRSLQPDSVTTITALPSTDTTSDRKYFITTGRKGTFSVFCIHPVRVEPNDNRAQEFTLSLVHQGSPPFGPMIEDAWFNCDHDLILYGFKSKNFVVWNETQQSEITSVDCGGAHRSYAYSPTQRGGHFLYTKASKLYLHSHRAASHQIIKTGGHGREIKACAVSENQKLFATGAEDTAIRIWSYSSSPGRIDNHFNCQAVVQKHTTGIQHLQWLGSSYLFSSGGFEEFFIWAISSMPDNDVGIMCEAIAPFASEDKDLRIMSFDVARLSISSHETSLLISLAYSDSTIRVYKYSKQNGYELIATGRYTSSCIMQIRCLQVSEGAFCLLTAATDGALSLWNGKITNADSEIEQELFLCSTKKVHQSSIKCLDISRAVSGNYILVATGGDDNALAVSVYQVSELFKPILTATTSKVFILRSAHAAAVTGVAFVPNSLQEHDNTATVLPERFSIVSSSNDQRIKEWDVEFVHGASDSNPVLQIKKAGDVFTPIADVGDLSCLRGGEVEGERKVLIVGNGMEVWNIGST